jgi:multidrug efflux pump subunit AcrA (membrane-fusion protein)
MKAPPPTPLIDATPTLARQVIDLYSVELADVRFPDLDLSALLYAQTELHASQLEVERVEAELADIRAQLEARSQALLAKAERALAYAKIYAQGDEDLAPRLADIGRKRSANASAAHTQSSPGLIAAPKRRGRKPKTEEAPEELFNESASA